MDFRVSLCPICKKRFKPQHTGKLRLFEEDMQNTVSLSAKNKLERANESNGLANTSKSLPESSFTGNNNDTRSSEMIRRECNFASTSRDENKENSDPNGILLQILT